MSEGRSALNWRGPLLAAALFAGLFGVLLLMARQNESNTSDAGSSLRQDPYGTSLLFDAYQRAGYRVERSQDQDSLADQRATDTTAFFIGGYPDEDFETKPDGKMEYGGKFRARIEDFLARGGRAVVINPNDGVALKSSSQGWEISTGNPNGRSPLKAGPSWAAPVSGVMPKGSEEMYLGADFPWLKTDEHWTALYVGPDSSAGGASNPGLGDPVTSAHVYMAMRPAGNGELIAAGQQSFLLNEAIKTRPNPQLLDFLAGGRREIWVDETLHGLQQEEGVLWLIQRYRLQAALLLFWGTLLALLWSMSGDLVRRPARDRDAEIIREGQHAGVAGQRLLQRSIAKDQVVMECWDQFRRRSPHDAEAIAGEAALSARLRAAFSAPPVEGYKQLHELIAERRASAKALVRSGGNARQEFLAS